MARAFIKKVFAATLSIFGGGNQPVNSTCDVQAAPLNEDATNLENKPHSMTAADDGGQPVHAEGCNGESVAPKSMHESHVDTEPVSANAGDDSDGKPSLFGKAVGSIGHAAAKAWNVLLDSGAKWLVKNIGFSIFERPIRNTIPSGVFSIKDVYELVLGDSAKATTKQLRLFSDKNAARDFKANNFDFVTFGGVFDQRSAAGLVSRSYLVTMDFDHVDDPQKVKETLINDKYLRPSLCFISPSGDGVKSVYLMPFPQFTHEEIFMAISNYLHSQYGLVADSSGKDICRACFLPHDPTAFYNPEPEQGGEIEFDIMTWKGNNLKPKVNQMAASFVARIDLEQHVSAVVRRIVDAGVDITAGYDNWCRLGFALAQGLGEVGRKYFHDISRLNAEYDSEETERQYTNCLTGRGQGVTIGTFFEVAKRAGVSIRVGGEMAEKNVKNVKKAGYVLSTSDGSDLKGIEGAKGVRIVESPSPTFSDRISGHCPSFVQKLIDLASVPEEADLLILGCLGVLGPCFSKIYTNYGRKAYHPCLFIFVLAIASGGKSVIDHCKQLVDRIHKELLEQAKTEAAAFERAKKEEKDDVDISEPRQRMLFIPANSSATSVYQILGDNDGVGLIVETEGDTMAEVFGSDFGNYSSGLRKIYEEETISYHRRGGNEHVEVDKPKLSVVLSGTYDQVRKLISDTENGLFSRFSFYSFESDLSWRNMFNKADTPSYESYLRMLGADVKTIYDTLRLLPEIEFKLTEDQQKKHYSFFEHNHSILLRVYGMDLYATSHRLGVMALRIAMILSALRLMEDGDVPESIVCRDEDFYCSLAITQTFTQHAANIYTKCYNGKKCPVAKSEQVNKLYDVLPERFTRDEFIECAVSLGIKEKTAPGYITSFLKKGVIARMQQGVYEKRYPMRVVK